MTVKIGDTVTLNGKEYKVTGTHKKSFILEREGKQYKATQDKIDKILNQNVNTSTKTASDGKGYLERRLAWSKLWNKSARIPETEEEVMEYFSRLVSELSPENLACDGEASRSQINAKLKEIRGAWAELEEIIGKSISERDVLEWERKNRDRTY